MEPFRTLRFLLVTLLVVCAPLAAQTVDTQSVTITYNGSSSPNTATVHVTNATNVTARIGSNINNTGAVVSSAGNTAGAFVQNVSESGPNAFLVNIGTDQNVLGALSRRGATTYTGSTLLISATGCTDCISVALTLQVTNGGGVTITYNGAAVPNTGISLFTSVGGFTSAQLTLTSANPTAFQASSNQAWLTVNPTAGQLTGSTTIQLNANAAGLPSGPNQAVIQISASGITTSITVTLNVGTSGGGLSLSPNPMNFSYVTSTNAFPSGQTQYLTLSGASSSATYTATAFSSPAWLIVGAGGGTTVSGISTLTQLPVSVNPAILNLNTAATYTGTVTITTTDGLTATLNVNFSVSASGTTGGTGTLTFTVPASGSAAPPAQQITISGSGSYTAFVGTNNCGQGWLSVSPTNGQLSTIATTLTVQVFPGNIGAATCIGTISISTTGLLQSGTNFQVINVTMQIGTSSGGGGPVASPAALTFTMPTGATQSQTFIVNGDGSAFSAQAIGTNLTVFPTNGTTPAILTVSAGSNSSSGTIVVNSSLGTQNVGVTVNVLGGNVLTANPAALSYIYTAGSSIANQSISINAALDSSAANLAFSVASAPSFISYAVTSPTTPSSMGVAVNAAQLGPGFNTGNIVLSANGAANPNLTIPVTVLAPGSTAGLTASVNPVALSAQQFGGPVSQAVSLTGLSGTNFTATTVSTGNWLSVCVGVQTVGCPNTGTSPNTLTITANPGTLSAQATAYTGTVTVTANNGTTLTILVNLTVTTTSPATPVLNVSPGALTFNYRTGDAAPTGQNIQVSTTNGSTSYTATTSTNWINLSPTSGNTPGTISVTVNTSLLTQPSQTGTVTITAPGATNSPQTVMVTANVTTPPSLTPIASTTFTYRTGDPTPPTQTVQVGSTGGALPFTVTVTNAPWLSVTPASGTTPATLTLSADPTKVQIGSYTATVTISSSGAASQSFTVGFNISAPLPTILEVRNGATNQAGPISPGLVIVMPGTSLGSDPPTTFVLNGDILGTRVANTRVLVGGYAAPVIFASSSLVAAIVPYEITGKTSTFVQVEYLGQRSNGITVQVANTAPGVFTPDSQALPAQAPVAGAVLNPDSSVNSASNPTSVGQVVSVLFTGEGLTLPAGIDGKLADDPAPAQPVLPVTASINGVPANVTVGAVLVAGVMQASVTVPAGATTGDLVLHIGGNDSQPGVTVNIQ